MFLAILTVGYAMTLGGYFVISDIKVRAQGPTGGAKIDSEP
jgi:hypothetical protein